MRALLDTHAFLWWLEADVRLSSRAREIVGNPANQLIISVICGWEIALKATLLLEHRDDLETYLENQISVNRFESLPFSLNHALRIALLPDHHKDPFDRALVAQSLVEGIPIVSADRALARYRVEVIW